MTEMTAEQYRDLAKTKKSKTPEKAGGVGGQRNTDRLRAEMPFRVSVNGIDRYGGGDPVACLREALKALDEGAVMLRGTTISFHQKR